uniref:Lymphoid restricted membrane protein n=1 Tax=Stegastes partitus TaxID=144197 RepID=A0A3B5B2C4_9TELE
RVCFPARACYLCWWRRRRASRTARPRLQQLAWRVRRESQKFQSWSVCFCLFASLCNFAHPHTNTHQLSVSGTDRLTSSGPTTTTTSSSSDSSSAQSANQSGSAEFQRLALGFKCDMFTLEKRLRLEERSRDLAEENVRREVSSCQGLLQALIPLCEDDNQSMEIIQRLQKNLDILIQSMTRVSSRSEMLGAIHQESRIGKAVEVMIQHVENLRRMYTKEHAELLELRETLMQNERSFGSQTERGWTCCTYGRSLSVSMHHTEPYEFLFCTNIQNMAGKSTARPPLKRFVSSAAWVDTEERREATLGCVVIFTSHYLFCAALLALLASLVMQPAVDAAPVGTGDSWMTIQQLLWPYTGLRHNGQPPV